MPDDYAKRLEQPYSLTSADEARLVKAVQQEDDIAQAELVAACERFVSSIVANYRRSRLPQERLLEVGRQGVIEAAKRYEPEAGYRFSTLATYWIRESIQKALDGA